MALSNWDTIAFGPDSKPCGGTFTGKNDGDSVEIYKNWLYVHSKSMWREGRSFVKDTIAEIHWGRVEILTFEILAKRGPQDAIFVFAKEFNYPKAKKGKKGWFKAFDRRFAGIGCYGFDDSRWIGVKPSTLKEFFTWLMLMDGAEEELVAHKALFDKLRETHPEIPPMTDEEALEQCKDQEHRAWVAECMKAAPMRFNQGDAYFAGRSGMKLPATEVGKADKPILMKILEVQTRGRKQKGKK